MFLLQPDIFFWDILIVVVLAFSGAVTVGCFHLAHRDAIGKTKTLVFRLLGAVAAALFLLTVYASFIEPNIIVVTKKTTQHPLGHDLKIAIVSDIHVGPYKGKAFVEKLVKRLNATLPDLVLLPGDFVYTTSADIADLQPLENISAPMGVYAVLGNHDVGRYSNVTGQRFVGESRGDAIEEAFTKWGIFVLRNEHDLLETHEGDFAIAGVDDIWTGHHDLPAAMTDIKKGAFTILLSHNPSIIDDPLSMFAHLVVSGHTHGGQIRIPGFGPIGQLPTSLGKNYDQGLFPMDEDTTLAITRGVGETHTRSRLFAWPEILLLQVEQKS